MLFPGLDAREFALCNTFVNKNFISLVKLKLGTGEQAVHSDTTADRLPCSLFNGLFDLKPCQPLLRVFVGL